MTKTLKALPVIAALVFGIASANAQADELITNGSFEQTNFAGTFTTLSAGSFGLFGWSVANGGVDLINTYWQAAQGSQYSVDLSAGSAGSISQTINTVSGQDYRLTFYVAGNPDGDLVKEMQVSVGGVPAIVFDAGGKSRSNMGWRMETINFKGEGRATTISFSGMNDSAYGMALDHVSVTTVPEPESFAMLLAGLGLVGVVARRRKNNGLSA